MAGRVLVVDDDRSNCEIVAKLLQGHGYQVDMAHSGPDALQLIMQNDYVLAVIDYRMPGMDGVEFFRKARELKPELHGVFLTGHTNLNTIYPAIDAGVERVLAKPADGRELLPLVDQLASQASGS